jgi:hypothetical protein
MSSSSNRTTTGSSNLLSDVEIAVIDGEIKSDLFSSDLFNSSLLLDSNITDFKFRLSFFLFRWSWKLKYHLFIFLQSHLKYNLFVLELETYKLFWTKMKKRNHNISVAKMNLSDNKSLRQIAESIFGSKVSVKKKKISAVHNNINKSEEAEERYSVNDLPVDKYEDMSAEEMVTVREDFWDQSYWDQCNKINKTTGPNLNEIWEAWETNDGQEVLDPNERVEMLNHDQLNSYYSEFGREVTEEDLELEELLRVQKQSKSFEGDFDLMFIIWDSVMKSQKQLKQKPDDKNSFLSLSQTSTKEEFSKALKRFSILNNVNGNGINHLLAVLKEHVPEVDWPIHTVENSGEIISDISKYCDEEKSMLEFHVCPQFGCCAFVGDYEKNIYCNKCGAERFRKCSHVGCRGKTYAECGHTFNNKISNKSLYYRPITSMIIKLLETDGFLEAMNFSFLNKTDSFKYMDCSHGSTYKKNYDEMCKNYEKEFAGISKENRPIMINLLLGQFFDGVALFKKKHSVFWPLVFIILNLPPSYRVRLGIGMFLLSVFTSKQHSNVEDFLLRTMVVGELKKLNEGIIVNVKGVNYFVQARMILTILDTIAVEDFLFVQTNQSLTGCFVCHNGKGYNYLLDRQVYIGCRNLSDLKHFCRHIGQSQKCCPPNYYIHGKQQDCFDVLEYENPDDIEVNEILLPVRIAGSFVICDKNNSLNLSTGLRNKNNQWVWHHPEYDPKIFRNDLYYHHCDYRPKIEYKRKTNDEYISLGEKNRLKLHLHPNTPDNKRHENGVKDTWPMAELDYSNIETDVCWGGMHSLMNVASNIIENWKGERVTLKTSKVLVNYCRLTATHPDLYKGKTETLMDKNGKESIKFTPSVARYKWEIPESVQKKVG